MCGLLLSVLMLKQIIMNLMDLCQPKCKEPKRYRAHKQKMIAHFAANSGDYGQGQREEDHQHGLNEQYSTDIED